MSVLWVQNVIYSAPIVLLVFKKKSADYVFLQLHCVLPYINVLWQPRLQESVRVYFSFQFKNVFFHIWLFCFVDGAQRSRPLCLTVHQSRKVSFVILENFKSFVCPDEYFPWTNYTISWYSTKYYCDGDNISSSWTHLCLSIWAFSWRRSTRLTLFLEKEILLLCSKSSWIEEMRLTHTCVLSHSLLQQEESVIISWCAQLQYLTAHTLQHLWDPSLICPRISLY